MSAGFGQVRRVRNEALTLMRDQHFLKQQHHSYYTTSWAVDPVLATPDQNQDQDMIIEGGASGAWS